MSIRQPLASALAALAALATPPALAQASQQTVITAPRPVQPPRADVHAACPEVADTLERELAPALAMWGKEGTVRVEFTLRGEQVVDVAPRGGPAEYRQPIKRAMRALACRALAAADSPGPAGGDRYVLAIRFDLGDRPEAPRRVARLVAP